MRNKLAFLYIFVFLFVSFQIPTLSFASEVPDLTSGAYILMDMKTGQVLTEKNSDHQWSPASTTKIMTALIALENSSLDKEMTATQTAINSVDIYNYVTAGIKPGEKIKLKSLLDMMLVTSANEAGYVIAENVSPDGTVAGFVKMMDDKAKELGLKGTHFSNPCGIEDQDHYSTAGDLAILGREAMKNEAFRAIVGETEIAMPDTNLRKGSDWNTSYLSFTNKLLTSHSKYYSKVTGVKTGFTDLAGRCLVSSAVNPDGMELLAVVLGADSYDTLFSESQSLLEYGFANFGIQDVVKTGKYIDRSEVVDAVDGNKVELVTDGDIRHILPLDSEALSRDLTLKKTLSEPFKAPIVKGQVMGSMEYFYKNESIGLVNIIANNAVEKTTFAQIRDKYMEVVNDKRFTLGLKILGCLIIFLIVLRLILRAISRRSKRNRRYNYSSPARKKNYRFKNYR